MKSHLGVWRDKVTWESEETKSFSPLIKRVVGETHSKGSKCEMHKFKEERGRSELKEKNGSIWEGCTFQENLVAHLWGKWITINACLYNNEGRHTFVKEEWAHIPRLDQPLFLFVQFLLEEAVLLNSEGEAQKRRLHIVSVFKVIFYFSWFWLWLYSTVIYTENPSVDK